MGMLGRFPGDVLDKPWSIFCLGATFWTVVEVSGVGVCPGATFWTGGVDFVATAGRSGGGSAASARDAPCGGDRSRGSLKAPTHSAPHPKPAPEANPPIVGSGPDTARACK